MLLSLRKNGLTSVFKEVRVFKELGLRWVFVISCNGLINAHGSSPTPVFLSRDAACNLDLLIDSMMMSFDALLGSRLQGHECKRKTA